jgi:outer membrane protein assembly factor BamB
MRWAFAIWCVLLLLRQSVFAADWPQWRGPDRDGHVRVDAAVPTSLPAEPKVLWHFKIGDGLASPVVTDGKVFYMDAQNDREVLHEIAETDGHELWRADLDATFQDPQSAPGPRCTPVVHDGYVFAQSCRGELRCFNVTNGSVVWRTSYVTNFGAVVTGEKGNAEGAARHGYAAAPLFALGGIYATVGGADGASVVCFEWLTGKVRWKSQDDTAAYAPPIFGYIHETPQIIVFTGRGLISLNPSAGQLFWRVPLKTSAARHVTTPVIEDDMIFVASHEIGLVGVKVSSDDGIAWQATKAWSHRELAINIASPVLAGGYIYGLGPEKNFICVEAKTGKLMWSQTGYITGPPDASHAAFIVMNKNILALTDGGQLVLFPADPKAFKEISRVQVCGKTWCNPAYSNGKLYLRDGRELMCVRLMD